MKKIIPLILILVTVNINSQTQIALKSAIKTNNLSSDQLEGNGIGWSLGFSSHSPINKNFEISLELGYTYNTYNLSNIIEDIDYNINLSDLAYNLHQINLNSIIDYYILSPKKNEFGISLLGGFGTTIFNKWKTENNLNNNIKNFKPYYIIGGCFSFERGKISLRYNRSLGNYLSDSYAYNTTNNDDKINLTGKNNSITVSFNYYIYN